MFEGSAIATMSVFPALLTGTTWWRITRSFDSSFRTSGSISKSERLMLGTPYCRARKAVSSFSSR